MSKRTVGLEMEQLQAVKFVRDEARKGFVVKLGRRKGGAGSGLGANDLVVAVNGSETAHMQQQEFDTILRSCESWPVPLKVLGRQEEAVLISSDEEEGEAVSSSTNGTDAFQRLWPVLSKEGWVKRWDKTGPRFRIPTASKLGYALKHGEDYLSSEQEVVEYCQAKGIHGFSLVGKEQEEEVQPARTRNLKRAPRKDDGDEFDFVPKANTAAAAAKEEEEEEEASSKKQRKATPRKSSAKPKSQKKRRKAKDSEEETSGTSTVDEEEVEKVVWVEDRDEVVIEDNDEEEAQRALPQSRPRTRGAAKRETEELADLVRQIDEQHPTPVAKSKRPSKEERELEVKLKLPRSCSQIPIITSCAKPKRSSLTKPSAAAVGDEASNGQIDLTLSSDEEREAASKVTVDVENDEDSDDKDADTATRFQRGQIVQTRYGIASVRYDYDSGRDEFLQVLFLWDMRQRIFPFGFLNLRTEPVVLDCTKQMVLPKLGMNRSDLARLWPGMYLNDTLINYFLSDLDLSSKLQRRVHVMTTHFFSKLASNKMSDVKSWTKNVDVFAKDFIVVPVNEADHWSLAIICFPGNLLPVSSGKAAGASDGDECEDVLRDVVRRVVSSEEQRAPLILKLDSTKSHPTTLVAGLLRKWIAQESKWKRECDLQVSAVALPVVVPIVPLQDNGCDCGVFLLAFAQHFLTELAWRFVSTEDSIRKRFKHEFGLGWFPTAQILTMRESMHKHIVALAAEATATGEA